MPNFNCHGSEILKAIDADIARIHKEHITAGKNLKWMPVELLPEDAELEVLSPEINAMLVLNLLTEDGLPYFLALLVHHLGPEHAIWEWSKRWTTEENRHGKAIGQYLNQVLTPEQRYCVEKLESDYLLEGFWPKWTDPMELISYVVLQERATMMSHVGIAKHARAYDDVLGKMMVKIGAEEAQHHHVYLDFYLAALKQDPSHCVIALQSAIDTFQMPGAAIPDFKVMSDIQARMNVFGPQQFAEIIGEVAKKIGLETLTGLSPTAEEARDKIFRSYKALIRIGEMLSKKPAKSLYIPFLEETVTV